MRIDTAPHIHRNFTCPFCESSFRGSAMTPDVRLPRHTIRFADGVKSDCTGSYERPVETMTQQERKEYGF